MKRHFLEKLFAPQKHGLDIAVKEPRRLQDPSPFHHSHQAFGNSQFYPALNISVNTVPSVMTEHRARSQETRGLAQALSFSIWVTLGKSPPQFSSGKQTDIHTTIR